MSYTNNFLTPRVTIKPDKRFKKGNLKSENGTIRINPTTLAKEFKRLEYPKGLLLNPPIVVSHELGEALKRELGRYS